MKKQKTRKELERIKEGWMMVAVVGWIFFIFTLGVSMYVFETEGHPVDLKQQLSECQDQVPEVINGNLYIGYENGVRVGYHQDYLNDDIWYRCARDCEVIE